MPLNIKDDETHEMARKLAGYTGQSLSRAVKQAIGEKLEQLERSRSRNHLADELDHIALHCAGLRLQNTQSAEEIIGYDEDGLPT